MPGEHNSAIEWAQRAAGATHLFGEEKQTPAQEVADWSAALRLDPDDAQAYLCRGAARLALPDHAAASADGDEALRREPDLWPAYRVRGAARAALRDFDAAIADFTEFLRHRPDDRDVRNRLGLAQWRRGDPNAALTVFDETVRLHPDDIAARLNRAMVFKSMRNYERAIAELRELLRQHPEYPKAHNNLAWYLATCPEDGLRDGKAALEHARKACELSGWSVPLYRNTLAGAYAEVGEFAEAVRRGKEALAQPERLPADRLEEVRGYLRHYEQRQPIRQV